LNQSTDHDALPQAEAFNHGGGHKGVGTLARIEVFGTAEEAVAVGMHFQHAVTRIERYLMHRFHRRAACIPSATLAVDAHGTVHIAVCLGFAKIIAGQRPTAAPAMLPTVLPAMWAALALVVRPSSATAAATWSAATTAAASTTTPATPAAAVAAASHRMATALTPKTLLPHEFSSETNKGRGLPAGTARPWNLQSSTAADHQPSSDCEWCACAQSLGKNRAGIVPSPEQSLETARTGQLSSSFSQDGC
jgi:hypothetical protein